LGLWEGDSEIGIQTWNSELFDPAHTSDIRQLHVTNEDTATLLSTVCTDLMAPFLSRDPASSAHTLLLGTIHEWLLELQLRIDFIALCVSLEVRAGHERRATGSYFTPDALVQNLLDVCLESAFDASIDDANPVATQNKLLQLRIVDPSCGTGVFLLAAARRLARRLDSIENRCQPSSQAANHSLRAVVSNCIYGVDIGSTAVALCRLVLWFECGYPYEPIPTLSEHIRCGNSVFGAWPGFETRGLADIAFEPAQGDDAEHAKRLKRRNRSERLGLLGGSATSPHQLDSGHVEATPESRKSSQFLADLWCAVYVWPKREGIDMPTERDFESACDDTQRAIQHWQAPLGEIARQQKFFHWHLQFADVFSGQPQSESGDARAQGGFDFVIGNPPWVAHAGRSTQHMHLGLKHFLRENYASFAGYPTTHGVFVELATRVLGPAGRIGFILPASVADLDGYAPTRRVHDQRCVIVRPLPDYGEGQFTGVTQPCIALVSQRRSPGRPSADQGKPWELERSDLDVTGLALLERLCRCATMPAELFGERGFQSTPALREFIRRQVRPLAPFSLPLREGTDVREFCLGDAQHYANVCLLKKGLRSLDEFAKVAIVVRQTARYPIAAKGDGVPFRNSLLAVLQHTEWPWAVLLCIINSSLIRWHHYYRFRDGRQPILPQLKVSHLRAMPAPLSRGEPAFAEVERMGVELAARNQGIVDSERARIDECVGQLYCLSPVEHRMVTDWHARRPR
jgi:tRNA1(Val) A37 N6-methylase TrmN6